MGWIEPPGAPIGGPDWVRDARRLDRAQSALGRQVGMGPGASWTTADGWRYQRDAGGMLGWSPPIAYTPSLARISLGSGGSVYGVWWRHGRWGLVRATVRFGSGGSVTSAGPRIGLPAAIDASDVPTVLAGSTTGNDATGSLYEFAPVAITTTQIEPRYRTATGSLSQITGSVPIPWTVNDQIELVCWIRLGSPYL